MPCYCGAIDCRSCSGPQGYTLARIYDPVSRGYVWVNPEDEDELELEDNDEPK